MRQGADNFARSNENEKRNVMENNLEDLQVVQTDPNVASRGIEDEKTKTTAAEIPAWDDSLALIEGLSVVLNHCKGSALKAETFDSLRPYFDGLARRLEITPYAVALLAFFMEKADDWRICIGAAARFFDCRNLDILKHRADIDLLVERGYIRRRQSNEGMEYRAVPEAVRAFVANEVFVPKLPEGLQAQEFFLHIDRLQDAYQDGEYDFRRYASTVQELLELNPQLEFARRVEQHGMGSVELQLFVRFCVMSVVDDDNEVSFRDVYENEEVHYVKNFEEWKRYSKMMKEEGLITNCFDGGLADANAFCLTPKTKRTFLAGTTAAQAAAPRHKMVRAADVVPKQLFYNEREREGVARLHTLIAPERFGEVQQSLRERGLRTGFACLFYGAPGTGKTETALQLARQTGRDLIRIDVTEVRSMWVGKSEENIKAVFDEYCERCEASELAPILLFNEADAILGRRMKGAERGADRMENSVQNIILQEMEDLQGILIATTNLTENLDAAFERRFLYKLRFDRPELAARAAIWQTMVPELGAEEARLLAARYDFTGGEIENVVRKLIVEQLLAAGRDVKVSQLVANICEGEGIRAMQRVVGF